MTGSLRLSALLLLLLSRWASADLEKGEDEYVRSWVIIEEQLVPPSRDELLAAGGVGGGGGGGGNGGAVAGRRITPKSVFVAPSFNKCSDGYRPDSMGRCVKVVKINQAAQWDFLLKQLNSMYGPAGAGGGFPVPGASALTTTTTEPPQQKTDSPGPFQVNIPLGMPMEPAVASSGNQTADPVDEPPATAGTTAAGAAITTSTAGGTTPTVANVVTADDVTIITSAADADAAIVTDPPGGGTATDVDADDHTATAVTATGVPPETGTSAARPRPYHNRYQTRTEDATTMTPSYESTTIIPTDTKIKYVDTSRTTTVDTDDSAQTIKTTTDVSTSAVTATAVDVTDADELVTGTAMTTTEDADDEEVVTVLAVSMGGGGRPSFPSRLIQSTSPPRVRYTVGVGGGSRTQSPPATDVTTPEYFDDQPEEPTSSPEPDCSDPNAYQYYVACAGLRLKQHQLQLQQQLQQQQQIQQQLQQQQQIQQQIQQQQLHQHQQQQNYQQQQQQQQFYHHHQQQQQQQQQPPLSHIATALVKRPGAAPAGAGAGVPVRFPEEVDPADSANLIRFPGPAPYRTTNKMYESSRHPTWWPTVWPEPQPQQQQADDVVSLQQQQQQQQQHRLQHHLPQQKQDTRFWEFGSRIPKTSTTAVPPTSPPTQWYRRFF